MLRRCHRAWAGSIARLSRGRFQPFLEALEDRMLPATVTWINPTDGDWNTPSNWSTGQLPAPADDVIINQPGSITITQSSGLVSIRSLQCQDDLVIAGGNFTFAADSSVHQLTFSSTGTLTGLADLTVSGLLAWSNGTMTGPGHTHANGGLLLDGTTDKTLDGRTLDNAGIGIFTGSSDLLAANGAVFNNAAGASLDIEGNVGILHSMPLTTTTFNNAGLLRRTVSVGTASISVPFSNTGSVDVQTGTLALSGTGLHTGSFAVAASATLNFLGVHILSAASRIEGAGAVTIGDLTGDSGNVTIAGAFNLTGSTNLLSGNLVFNTSANTATANLRGGRLDGFGTLTINGLLTWTGGAVMGGAGETVASGGMIINNAGLDGRTVENSGTATWTGGSFSIYNGALFHNLSTATFLAEADNNNTLGGGGFPAGSFLNEGTFRRVVGLGPATTTVSFTNSGTIDVESGSLNFYGTGTHGGTFTIAAAAALAFGGHHILTANSTINSAGTLTFGEEVTRTGNVTLLGRYTITGTTRIVDGGSANFLTDVTLPSLTMTGGSLGGTGTVTVNGLLDWSSGMMTGSGRTVARGGLSLTGRSGESLDQRTLSNEGTATWTGTGDLSLTNGALFDNLAGAMFVVSTSANINGSTGATFNNSGTFRKSSGQTTTVSPVFANSGTADLANGTLVLENGGTSSGRFLVSAGTTLTLFLGTFSFLSTSILSGAGSVYVGYSFSGPSILVAGIYDITGTTTLANGTLTFANDVTLGDLTMTGGTLTGPSSMIVRGAWSWAGGTLAGFGNTRVEGTLVIASNSSFPGPVLAGRILNNAGTITLTGQTYLGLASGAALNNLPGYVVDAHNDSALISGDNSVAFNNAGTFQKSAGTGVTSLALPFYNTGTVALQTGTVLLSTSAHSGGAFSVLAGATLELGPNGYVFDAASRITGPGRVLFDQGSPITYVAGAYTVGDTVISTGTVNFIGNAITGTATLTNGALSGTGTFTISGLLTWNGGTMTGYGTTVANGGVALGGRGQNLSERTFDNAGTATWTSAGNFSADAFGVFNNLPGALFLVENDFQFSGGTFQNSGTFRKAGSTGVTTLATQFNTSGTVDLQTGRIDLTTSGTSSGTWSLASGTSLTVSRGSYTLAGGGVRGAGFQVTGGTLVTLNSSTVDMLTLSSGGLDGAGNLTVSGTLNWIGGTINGAGSLTIPVGAALAIGNNTQKVLTRRTVNNYGTITWAGADDIFLTLGAAINNQAGATFVIGTNRGLYGDFFSTTSVNNAGILRASVVSGTAFVNDFIQFTNTGTVNVISGTLWLEAGFSNLRDTALTGGTYLVVGTLKVSGDLQTNAAAITLESVPKGGNCI